MGLLDDVLGSAVPQGSVSKPLMIALTALLASRATGSGGVGNWLDGSQEMCRPATSSPSMSRGTRQP
jgi:hypothetical protein